MPDKVALREKEFGIWQSFTWREYHDHVRDFSLGLVALGLQPRRQGRHHRRQPAGVGLERDRRAGRRRRLGRPLPGLQPQRGGLRHRPLRRRRSWWPRTRSRSTRSSTCWTSCPRSASVVFTDPRGLRKYQHEKLLAFDRRCEETGRELAAAAARALGGPTCARGQVDRRGHHLLHLGHHRLPQGGHALLPQPALHGAEPARRWTRSAPTTSSSPSCRWPGSASR